MQPRGPNIGFMNRTPQPPKGNSTRIPDTVRREVLELQGYQEIGMQKQALQLARSLLIRHPTVKLAVSEALWAILIQADGLKRWRRLLERAYRSLPSREQRKLRILMLGFYVSLQDWKATALLLP